LKTHLIQSNLL